MNHSFVYGHIRSYSELELLELINRMRDQNMLSLIAAQLIHTLFYKDVFRQGHCSATRNARQQRSVLEVVQFRLILNA